MQVTKSNINYMTDSENMVKNILTVVQQKGYYTFPEEITYLDLCNMKLFGCDTCGSKIVSKETLVMLFTMARYVVQQQTEFETDFSDCSDIFLEHNSKI